MCTLYLSYADKINQQNVFVYDLRLKLHNEDRYFIIKVNPTKRDAFITAIGSDVGYYLKDFGEVIHRGWGEPSDDLKKQLRNEYNMYNDPKNCAD